MKEIIALQQYTDKFISLYQGEIRNIQDSLADKLIEQGIVAEHTDEGQDGENNDGKKLFIENVNYNYDPDSDNFTATSDKTITEINQAYHKGLIPCINAGNLGISIPFKTISEDFATTRGVEIIGAAPESLYISAYTISFYKPNMYNPEPVTIVIKNYTIKKIQTADT